MIIWSVIGKQAQHPSGLVGRIVARVMTRTTLPSAMWTAELMEIEPTDRVLEVGFGNGASIEHLTRLANRGHVAGAEVSETMLDVASRRNAAAIADGRVELRQADGSSLPFDEGSFDKACTNNTVYILKEPIAVFKEMFRVLKPGGLVAVNFPVRENFMKFRPTRTPGFYLHKLDDLRAAVEDAGFENVRLERTDRVKFGAHCLLGSKPTA